MSLLKQALQSLIRDTIDENSIINQQAPNEQGVVMQINPDGTVNVQTATSLYQGVGTPVVRTLNEQVVVVTADGGVRVAV